MLNRRTDTLPHAFDAEFREAGALLSFDNIGFDYDPFPIGIATPVVEAGLYQEMVAQFPPLDMMRDTEKHGDKRSLSRKNNRKAYEDHIANIAVWRDFHRYIRSPDFILSTLEMLRSHRLDLGLDGRNLALAPRLGACLKQLLHGNLPSAPPGLSARFEFSALPAAGGAVIPHTDTINKIITFVISILEEGTWDSAIGGGTEVMRPRDPNDNFNQTNRQLGFDEVETLKTFEYRPNQAVVFIKTFNSLHGVRPMTGKATDPWRKTLTVNIMRDH